MDKVKVAYRYYYNVYLVFKKGLTIKIRTST